MERVTLREVKKSIREKGYFKGVATGNKVRDSLALGQETDHWGVVIGVEVHSLQELEQTMNSLLYYLPTEYGTYLKWYM